MHDTLLTNINEETLPSSTDGTQPPYRFDWSRDLQFPLFKAMSREWFDHFKATDEVFINTTFNLANEAKFGRGIGDKNEGSRSLIYPGGTACDTPIKCCVSAVNTYIFCCASRIGRQLIRTWNAEAVYKINSIEFFRAITKALREQSSFCIVAPVVYANWQDFNTGIPQVQRWIDAKHPPGCNPETMEWPSVAFMKDHDLAYQHEVRATWEPPFSATEQQKREIFGQEARNHFGRWDNDRLGLLTENGVRPDIVPMPLRVSGIQDFIEEIPIDQID